MYVEIHFFQGLFINKWGKEHLSHFAQRYREVTPETEKADETGAFRTEDRSAISVLYPELTASDHKAVSKHMKLPPLLNTLWSPTWREKDT